MICPHCAFPNEAGTRVCKKCHRPIKTPATAPVDKSTAGSQNGSPAWMQAPSSTPPAPEIAPPSVNDMPTPSEEDPAAAKDAGRVPKPSSTAAPAPGAGETTARPAEKVATCLAEAREKEQGGDLRGAFLACQSLLIDNYGDIPAPALASLYTHMGQISKRQGKEERARKYEEKAALLRRPAVKKPAAKPAQAPGPKPPQVTETKPPQTTEPEPQPPAEPQPTEIKGGSATEVPLEERQQGEAADSSIEKALSRAIEQSAPAESSQQARDEEPEESIKPAPATDQPEAASQQAGSLTEPATGVRLALAAGFWSRLAAFLLDTLIVTSVVMGMMVLSSVLLSEQAVSAFKFFTQKLSTLVLALSILVFFLLAYLTIFAYYGGQTAGMMLMGLRVVKLDGHSITPFQAVRRALGMLLAAIPGLAGFLWAAFDLNRRGWHDYIGGTLVVHIQPGTSEVAS